MAGELPFEKPLNDLRQKITELKSLSMEKEIDFSEEILRLELNASRWKKIFTTS